MFQINLAKLSDYDTQVLTLINLSPDSWVLGMHPTLVCYHEGLGWFHRHWIFGVQPYINSEQGGYNRLRRLTWRGQLLLRRKVREIKRSAVDLNLPEVFTPAPGGTAVPTSPPAAGASPLSAIGTSTGLAQAQAHRAAAMRDMMQAMNNHAGDALTYGLSAMNAMGAMDAKALKPQQMIHMHPPSQQEVEAFAGHTRKELLDAGCPPDLVSKAFKGNDTAVDMLVDWSRDHM